MVTSRALLLVLRKVIVVALSVLENRFFRFETDQWQTVGLVFVFPSSESGTKMPDAKNRAFGGLLDGEELIALDFAIFR
jgi:hypothetical protein